MRKSVVLGVVTVLAMLTVSNSALANSGSCRLSDLRGLWVFTVSGVATKLNAAVDPIRGFGFRCSVVFDRDGFVFDSRCRGDDEDPVFEPLDFELFEVDRNCDIRANILLDTQAIALVEGFPEGVIGCPIDGVLGDDVLIASSHCRRTLGLQVVALQMSSRIRVLPPE